MSARARIIAALAAVLAAVHILSARATVAGLAVPVIIPAAAVALVALALAVWLIARRVRAFRSCPHPHEGW